MNKFSALVQTVIFSVLFLSNAYAQDWEWVNSYSCPNQSGSFFEEVIYDNHESLIAVGVLQDSVIFNTDTLGADYWNVPSPAYGDMLIAKFDYASGTEQWVKRFGGYGYSVIFDAIADHQGNIYCAGFFWDTLHLDSDTLYSGGSADAVLIKLDPTGQVIWYQQLEGTSGFIQNNGIAMTDHGTIVMIADYDSEFTVDGVTVQELNQSSWTNHFIGGFSQNGDLLWHHTYQGASDVFTSTAIDIQDDKIAVCAAFEGALNIDGNFFLPNTGNEWDIVTFQLDTLGTVEWIQPVNSNWYDFAQDVEFDIDGNVITVGNYADTIDFGGLTSPLEQEVPHTTYGLGTSIFVTKYDNTGSAQWAYHHGGFTFGSVYRVETDEFGNIYCAGAFDGEDSIAGTFVPSWGVGTQHYSFALDPNANEQWILANYPGNGQARGLAMINNEIFTAGQAYCDSYFESIFVDDPYQTCQWQPTVTRITDNVLSVENPDPFFDLSVYPNPATNQINILSSDKIAYEILDMKGRIVTKGSDSVVDISHYSAGIYAIKCNIGSQTKVVKFVKE